MFQIFTRRVNGAAPTQQTNSGADCFRPFWSSDGARIYYLSEGDLWAVSEAGGAAEKIADRVRSADVSNSTLALSRPDANGSESLWILDPNGPLRRIDLKMSFASLDVQFSPDGKHLGLAGSDLAGASGFWLMPVGKSTAQRELSVPLVGFSWMPDSKHILYSQDHLWLADTQSGKRQELTLGAGRENWSTVSPPGFERRSSGVLEHHTALQYRSPGAIF